MQTDQSFAKLIQPLFEICIEASVERNIPATAMASAMIGAGRDVLIAEAGPAVAATALLAALDSLREAHPDAANSALEAAARSEKKPARACNE